MLEIVPISLKDANAFVTRHHRHHQPVVGHKFSVAVSNGEKIVGVAIVGRPRARLLDDGWTLEVNRTCTDGTFNANSKLYAACRDAAKALGYRKLITYILPEEGGASLKAVGWKCEDDECGGGSWNTPTSGRYRIDKHPTGLKMRWAVNLGSRPELSVVKQLVVAGIVEDSPQLSLAL